MERAWAGPLKCLEGFDEAFSRGEETRFSRLLFVLETAHSPGPSSRNLTTVNSRIERLDETNPTSLRTQNSDISKSENYPSNEPSFFLKRDPRQEEKKRREEEKRRRRLLHDHRRSSAGPPPDVGVPPDRHLTSEFCRTAIRRRSSPTRRRGGNQLPTEIKTSAPLLSISGLEFSLKIM
ncbi:hypothetical protein M5K25_004294 [Dendrobium thyrsiflorum]|uniref:Uncharacterized protein n=1 Tax=Dendrobium thyrsiflorum TaxID=117978 RepID=A0ABD0VU19_DENTH